LWISHYWRNLHFRSESLLLAVAENAMQQSTPGYPIIDSSKRLTDSNTKLFYGTGSGRLSSSDEDLLMIKLVGDKTKIMLAF
jgi:hypothetical protein